VPVVEKLIRETIQRLAGSQPQIEELLGPASVIR